MKKTLLLFVAALMTFQVATAQEKSMKRKNHSVATNALRNNHPVTPAAAFWSDDFSSPANWTISNQAGNTDNWVITTTGPAGSFAIPAITSTSAANGFALFDSDLLCSGNQIADITNATPINCTGKNLVKLSFEQYYRRYDDSTFVFVSNNGTNWVKFPVNVPLTNNAAVANNSELTSLDITSVAANQATVYIRFQFWSPNTYTPTPSTNPAGCGYAWMIDDVALSEECSGPSSITVANDVVCPGSTADLSFTPSSGQTYQWQETTNLTTWTNIPGATTATVSPVLNQSTAYRVITDCGGGSIDTSDFVVVIANPTAPLCYCIPANPTCDGLEYISDVTISGTTLNLSTLCDTFLLGNSYTFVDPSITTATLAANTSYNLNVTTSADNIISVWIDYNQNGTFEDTEWTQVATTSVAGTASTVAITIPSTALNGLTGMRIRSRLTGNPNAGTDACTAMGSGETEDYFVTITGGVGIAENQFAKAVVKPSITGDIINVDLGTSQIENTRYSVYNMLGNVVINNQTVNTAKFDVSLGAFEAGMYVIRVFNGSSNFSQRVTLVK